MLSKIRRSLGMAAQPEPGDGARKEVRRGLVIGELLVAFLLLAVAISSLTALMYSVTRHPRTRTQAECTEKGAAGSPKCVAQAKATNAGKLLFAGCATPSGARVQACNDSVLSAEASDATTLRSRTDSASLEMLPKKSKRTNRPDLGFIR